MKFGRVPFDAAVGTVLAHTLRAGGRVLKKGRVLDAADVAALAAAGHEQITVARLEPDDLGEDEAAGRVGAAIAAAGVRVGAAATGRCNLFAAHAGVVSIDSAAIDALNRRSEAITCATLSPYAPVCAGALVATVKIITFGVPAALLAEAARVGVASVAVHRWRGVRAGLILTAFDPQSRLLARAAAAQRERLRRVGGELAEVRCTRHDVAEVAAALHELCDAGLDPILLLGASAVMDRRDVIPAAMMAAGGFVEHLGMPVDPGNLLVLGRMGTTSLIGVPGCARSLKRSGFDVVLERVAAGVPVGAADLMSMGVGGLLDEVVTRPQPRSSARPPPAAQTSIAAVVLAAGRSSRMGAASNKLLALVDGRPLVRHVVEAALGSRASRVVVVTGNQASEVRAALAGLDVTFVHNSSYAAGMSTSLKAGLAAVGPDDGALICLGDMPRVRSEHLDAIIAAFAPDDTPIVVPTCARKRGNPVLWGRALFAEIAALRGDIGARALIDRHVESVRFLPLEDDAILVDVDTPESLASLTS
jgi:molybdenum cofactor cytidylyltransferase